MAGKGLKPNTLLPWSSSLFIEHEVTRGTATSPGRDAILSQLYSPTPPSPSATVFFHILPFATARFFYSTVRLFYYVRASKHAKYAMVENHKPKY